MTVRRVVRHEVEDQLQATGMDLLDQPAEVGKRAKDRIDPTIIGDVIAEVRHR